MWREFLFGGQGKKAMILKFEILRKFTVFFINSVDKRNKPVLQNLISRGRSQITSTLQGKIFNWNILNH